MMELMKKILLSLVVLHIVYFVVPSFANCQRAYLQPLKGRLVKLQVPGSEDVKNMMENFLTEHDFILVDDEYVPLLKVDAEGIRRGGLRECTVIYRINKLELRLPQGGKIYSFSGKSAYGYGTEDAARHSAVHLLKEYLNNDETLMAKLNEVTYYNYYNVGLPDEPIKEELAEITRKILELTVSLERNDEVRKRLQDIGKKQTLLSKDLAKLAKLIKKGRAQISEQAVVQVLNSQKHLLRAQKIPYSISATCRQAESRDYSAIGAVLIGVPTRILRSGTYGIYADNQCLVYKRTTGNAGPRVFSSMELLRESSIGHYFRLKDNYLEIKAIDYHAEDHSIIVSKCHADCIMYANTRGMHPDKIFTEGRVLLIPLER